MSAVTYASIASALTTKFRNQIDSQINRAAVALVVLPKSDEGDGKEIRWSASFGTAVGSARAEGLDVAVFNADSKVPAFMDYGNYDDAFSINGKAIRAAAQAGNPAQLAALFKEQMKDSIERLAKGVAIDVYNGTGAAPQMHGLLATAGPLSATGVYANIDRSTYPQWASNVYANNGNPRALTKQLMRRVRRGIYTASGRKPNLILCAPSVHEAYGNTFQQERKYYQEINIGGQKITLDGGYAVLEFDGIPVVEDVDCADGEMLFLDTTVCALRELPDVGAGNPAADTMSLSGTPESQFGEKPSQLTARVNYLSRSGDKVNFQLIGYYGLQVRRPNACGRLRDISFDDAI
jgi:hypothetical protein